MHTPSGTASVWQSGRLAPHASPRPVDFGRQQWLFAGLLVLSAIVLTMFVVVLERDVDSGDLRHAAQRSRAVAEAQCEADRPATQRGRCLALFNEDAAVVGTAPAATSDNAAVDGVAGEDNAARASTLALLAGR